MDFAAVVMIGLRYGLLMAALLSVLFIGLAIVSPESWVNDYPADIRAKYGPMGPRAWRLRKLSAIPLGLILFLSIYLGLQALSRAGGGVIRFVDAFAVLFTMLLVFNLIDLLLIDWLLFVTIQPAIIILPGTEGMAGYKDMGFHLRAFGKGLIGSVIVSLVIALIASLGSAIIK